MRKTLVCIMCVLHYIFLPLLVVLCLVARCIPKKYDVGMGPLPMISYIYWSKALRKFGYRVQTFCTKPYYITNDFDVTFDHGLKKLYYLIPMLSFLRCCLLYRCMYIHFNGGPLMPISGLRLLEPSLFHLAGVKTVVMPYGGDCQILDRTPNKATVDALCRDYPDFYRKKRRAVTRQVEAWSRGADIVIGAMDSIDYLFFWNRIRACHFAIDTDAFTPSYPSPREGGPIKILHAPNHKAIKGTPAVMQAIKTLQEEGYSIELIFKQGVPNKEFLEIVGQADIVIDQLIMGWYAMFAMEAMSLGKPVICYMRGDLVDTFANAGCLEKTDIPFISAQPHTITDVLRGLLDAPETLADIGKKSRAYVEKYHSLESVGAFYDEINRSLGILPKEPS